MKELTDNELIADFMDEAFIREKNWHRDHWKDMPFDTSWDWLMPVVEKIYKLEYDGVTSRGVKFTLKNSRAVIKDGKKTFSCHTISPINSTYRVVVEFIKWYNAQKRQFCKTQTLTK